MVVMENTIGEITDTELNIRKITCGKTKGIHLEFSIEW